MIDNMKHPYGHMLIGDCLDVMKGFSDDCIDLIVTSPPYGLARKHDYGGIASDGYVEWFLPRAAEMLRVLKPSGSFVLNLKEGCFKGERHPYVYDLVLAMRRRQGWRLVDEFVWHKKNSVPGKWPTRFRDGWERLFHFTKSPEFKMRQDSVRVPISEASKDRVKNLNSKDIHRTQSSTGSRFTRNYAYHIGKTEVYPDNVLQMAVVSGNVGHSAPFPRKLPEFFIKLFTDAGDVVLDPFAGSGTTCKEALRLSRVPIGIEINGRWDAKQYPIQVRLGDDCYA